MTDQYTSSDFLRNRANELASQIDLLNRLSDNCSSLDRAVISDVIMSLIRTEHTFIPRSFADLNDNVFRFKNLVTINPKDTVYNVEIIESPLSCYCIRAYSFGPYDAKEYFKLKKEDKKILYILKEPYCESVTEINGELIKTYNQAQQYNSWKNVKKNCTHKNVIKIVGYVLDRLGVKIPLNENNSEIFDDEAYLEIRKHLCILEVNHFPGLAFCKGVKSDDNIITQWGMINQNLLSSLINFYSPSIIIGDSGSLSSLTTCNNDIYGWEDDWCPKNLFNWLKDNWQISEKLYPELVVDICGSPCNFLQPFTIGKHISTAIRDDARRIWITNRHPGFSYWSHEDMKSFAKGVQQLMDKYG